MAQGSNSGATGPRKLTIQAFALNLTENAEIYTAAVHLVQQLFGEHSAVAVSERHVFGNGYGDSYLTSNSIPMCVTHEGTHKPEYIMLTWTSTHDKRASLTLVQRTCALDIVDRTYLLKESSANSRNVKLLNKHFRTKVLASEVMED